MTTPSPDLSALVEQWARQTNLDEILEDCYVGPYEGAKWLTEFAALAMQHQRELDAKACEALEGTMTDGYGDDGNEPMAYDGGCSDCARAIRTP